MTAEGVAAGAAVVAVIVSIVSLVLTVYLSKSSDSDRKRWEDAQDTKRQDWAKDLQKQNQEWEDAWRQELKERENALRTPKLEVAINLGFRVNRFNEPFKAVLLNAINTGLVDIYLSNWGQLILPDGRVMEMPFDQSEYARIQFDPSKPVVPGDAASAYWALGYLKRQLRKNGYAGDLELRAQFVDRLGNKYVSDPLSTPILVDEQPEDDS